MTEKFLDGADIVTGAQYSRQLLRLFSTDDIFMNCYLEPSTFLSEMIRLIFIFVQHEVDAHTSTAFENILSVSLLK